MIDGDNPYDIAGEIALQDWSYSDKAVVAVIDKEFKNSEIKVDGIEKGVIPRSKVYREPLFSLAQTNTLNPTYKEFDVGGEYKYIHAEVWWDCLILGPGIMIPTGDPDVQLYFKEEDHWMQATAAAFWNVYMPTGHEYTSSHIYKSGKWQIGVTDLPTEGEEPPRKNRQKLHTKYCIKNIIRYICYSI